MNPRENSGQRKERGRCGFEVADAEAELVFTIRDAWGDGMCCSHGLGHYELSSCGVVIASGGDFGVSESTTFTDPSPLAGESLYMVRAIKLESSASGTYNNLSCGAVTAYSDDRGPRRTGGRLGGG